MAVDAARPLTCSWLVGPDEQQRVLQGPAARPGFGRNIRHQEHSLSAVPRQPHLVRISKCLPVIAALWVRLQLQLLDQLPDLGWQLQTGWGSGHRMGKQATSRQQRRRWRRRRQQGILRRVAISMLNACNIRSRCTSAAAMACAGLSSLVCRALGSREAWKPCQSVDGVV